MRVWQWMLIGIVVVMLASCGGVAQGGADEIVPVFTSSATATVAENQTSAITLKATDASMPITYSISGGDAGSFDVDASSGVVIFKVAPDFETKTSYTFIATATDAVSNSATQSVAVTITDVDEIAPVFTSSATATVAENQTTAITLVATDASMPIIYSISDGEASDFVVDASSGVVTFKSIPDFETKDTYGFTATATDNSGNETTQSVTIYITDMPEGPLKKTGQTLSYDEHGNVVTDNSIKDDGYYQAGVEPSYTRDDAKQIVTDHITGLEWQDDTDANTVRKQWLTDANYDKCRSINGQIQDITKCYDTSGDTAATYCENLSLDGGGWRLPTIHELMYIADRSKINPAIDPIFKHTASGYYLSSTTIVGIDDFAWNVYFYYGCTYCLDEEDWKAKDSSLDIRCVRAKQ